MSDTERSLIGAALQDPRVIAETAAIASPFDMSAMKHEIIWQTICNMDADGDHVSIATVAAKLREAGKLKLAGGVSYLNQCEDHGDVGGAATLARHVSSDARLRKLQSAARTVLNSSDVDAAEEAVWEALNASTGNTGSTVSAYDAALMVEERVKLIAAGGLAPGLKTGIQMLDEATGGLQPETLNILAARPSVGKTAFALGICKRVSANGGSVLFFSLETPADKLIRRLIADLGGISLLRLVHGRMDDESFRRMREALIQIEQLKLHIDDLSTATVPLLRALARRHKAIHGLDLIVIDYLQLIGGPGNNDVARVTAVSKALKAMGRDLCCPIIALSQLRRLQGEESRPRLSDLRESGQIEQDADTVMFLMRDRDDRPGLAKLFLDKNKEGPLTDVPLRFNEDLCRFSAGTWEDWGDHDE